MTDQQAKALRRNGANEFVARAYRQLGRLFSYRFYYNAYFVRKHGLNTSMVVRVDDLGFADSRSFRDAKEHHPSPPYKVMKAIKALKRHMGDFGDAGFVDYGCGAGRGMVIAAEAGFRNIIGLELSPMLLSVCRENIAKYSNRNSAVDMLVLEQDATTYVPEKSSTVFFFNVPFGPEAYGRALANIELSVATVPRTVHVLDFAWSKADFSEKIYERIGQVEGMNLYRMRPHEEWR